MSEPNWLRKLREQGGPRGMEQGQDYRTEVHIGEAVMGDDPDRDAKMHAQMTGTPYIGEAMIQQYGDEVYDPPISESEWIAQDPQVHVEIGDAQMLPDPQWQVGIGEAEMAPQIEFGEAEMLPLDQHEGIWRGIHDKPQMSPPMDPRKMRKP